MNDRDKRIKGHGRFFTLLELMIVMAILSLVGGFVAIGINKALVDQRFRTEVSLIVDELRLAQDLMLILGTDVHVKFKAESKGVKHWLELETGLSPNIERELFRKNSPLQDNTLKTIRGVFMRDYLNAAQTPGQVDIKFLSKGSVMSKGVLRLSISGEDPAPEGVLQSFICLVGYPRPISSTDDRTKAEAECNSIKEVTYDLKLTHDTFARLPERLKKQEVEEKVEEQKPPPVKPKEGKKTSGKRNENMEM